MTPAALIVDYGGVLTTPLSATVGPWLEQEGIAPEAFAAVMRDWLSEGAAPNVAHDLETGRIAPTEFSRQFAARLRRADGSEPAADGLLERMFAGFRDDPGMAQVLVTAKGHGLKTALLSNSWGNEYSRAGWDRLFDVVVISGEVGMRKPDAEIYLHTATELGVDPAACVFVDDLGPNVRAAVALGMIGVRHRDTATTVAELEAIFDLPFS